MSQAENASNVRGPKQGLVKQSEFTHRKDDFDGLKWGECKDGKQYAPTTRMVGNVEVAVTAERECVECTSSGCPLWRPEYRVRVRGQ